MSTQYRSLHLVLNNPPNQLHILNYVLTELLFAQARKQRYTLHIYAKIHIDTPRSIWTFVENYRMTDYCTYTPYFDYPRSMPEAIKSTDLLASAATPLATLRAFFRNPQHNVAQKRTLFVCMHHPGKYEGNSRYMLDWLQSLRTHNYTTDLLYYASDYQNINASELVDFSHLVNTLQTVMPKHASLGWCNNGGNVHADDWCPPELIHQFMLLTDQHCYNSIVVNYAFLSNLFTFTPSYCRKILLTHDKMSNRNLLLRSQGVNPSSGMSITAESERIACLRADIIVASNQQEADYFRESVKDTSTVIWAPPIMAYSPVRPPVSAVPIRIGYFGSANYVNELNLAAFLAALSQALQPSESATFAVAGPISQTICNFINYSSVPNLTITNFGSTADLQAFIATCHFLVNPERGGTGIKIKTLECLAAGALVLTTAQGAIGLDSTSKYHQSPDIATLAVQVAELIRQPELLSQARHESQHTYQSYMHSHRFKHAQVLGGTNDPIALYAEVRASNSRPILPLSDFPKSAHEAPYHRELFQRFASQVTISGKSLLEIGSDYNLISANLFRIAGASRIVATNLHNWYNPSMLRPPIEFFQSDGSSLNPSKYKFDLIYGIAILEHIASIDNFAANLHALTSEHTIIYLQGGPLWPSSVGHHIYNLAEPSPTTGYNPSQTYVTPHANDYRFDEPALNPIRPWLHLNLNAKSMALYLRERGILYERAQDIADEIYGGLAHHQGASSNQHAASTIISSFRQYFNVIAKPTRDSTPPNEAYLRARDLYSDFDLTTISLELWMTPR